MCDGSAVNRTLYAALFTVIGTTYGTGDGSSTFNLPNLTDRFVQGSATAGSVKNAGLPNLYGSITASILSWAGNSGTVIGNGVFVKSGETLTSLKFQSGSSGSYFPGIVFNASEHNSIYGNSTTVQPPALTMKFAIYSGVVSKKLWQRTI